VEHRHWPATYLDPPEDELYCLGCRDDLDWDDVSDDAFEDPENIEPDPLEV